MSFFPASENVFYGATFIDISTGTTYTPSGPSGIEVLLTVSTPDATYDSSARDPPPRCFPGTREQYVEEITRWAISDGDNAHLPILWMKGPAGVGKSAVAQTCAERLKGRNKPFATFFFSIKGQNDPKRLFPSVAYQLSTILPEYHAMLDKMIRMDRTLVDKSARFQLQNLIIEPLRQLHKSGKGFTERVPILIDGLDECDGTEAQRAIIDLIAKASQEESTQLCWAFFSRPEPHIESMFSRPEITELTHRIFLPISHEADKEIALFLRSGFREIVERTNAGLEPQWPSDKIVESIVHAAWGLFIYAAAVLRFIGNSEWHNPVDALSAVLELIDSTNTAEANINRKFPLAELDTLYTFILSRIPAETTQETCLFFSLCCLSRLNIHRSAIVWSNMLRISRVRLRAICNQLSAVLRFREKPINNDIDTNADNHLFDDLNRLSDLDAAIRYSAGGSISFYHKSFIDFLMEPSRSAKFCATSPAMYEALLKHTTELWLDYDSSISLPVSEWDPSSAAQIVGQSPLSDPHPNEFANLAMIGNIYNWIYHTSTSLVDSGVVSSKVVRQALNKCDFSKGLHARSSHLNNLKNYTQRTYYRGSNLYMTTFGGSLIFRVPPNSFADLDITGFRRSIQNRLEAGMIRPYYPNLTFRLKGLLQRFRPSTYPAESGLFKMGRGEKGIIWFWEINHEKKYFQLMQSPNMDSTTKVHGEENIRDWLKNWNERSKRGASEGTVHDH
ncbi:hypothetical protein D9756_007790 [Leucocoprinus leucothites]|uniref:Nephrocystin 3-like N-terminal domain-containing protein n=1 Tax=Leucocoprinus leucothites TaxID=201217 RepID=A0A8H5D401_9AGAR|nr:hypothetical protein D9756_007790 [Leucoagaricus leucothites]